MEVIQLKDDDDDFIHSVNPSAPRKPATRNPAVFKDDKKLSSRRPPPISMRIDSDPILKEDEESTTRNGDECSICGSDLRLLNEQRRTHHLNSCMDNDEAEADLDKTMDKWRSTMDCPVCKTPLADGPFRSAHIKKCGREHAINSRDLLQLVNTQEKVAETRRKRALPNTSAKTPKLRPKKVSKLDGEPKNRAEEEMRMAKAHSASLLEPDEAEERKEEEKNKKKKRKEGEKRGRQPTGLSPVFTRIINENIRKRRSYAVVELAPRGCRCDVLELIQSRFLSVFRARKKVLKRVEEKKRRKKGDEEEGKEDEVKERLSTAEKHTLDRVRAEAVVASTLSRLSSLSWAYRSLAAEGEQSGDVTIECSDGQIRAFSWSLRARTTALGRVAGENARLSIAASTTVVRHWLQYVACARVEWTAGEENERMREIALQSGPEGLVEECARLARTRREYRGFGGPAARLGLRHPEDTDSFFDSIVFAPTPKADEATVPRGEDTVPPPGAAAAATVTRGDTVTGAAAATVLPGGSVAEESMDECDAMRNILDVSCLHRSPRIRVSEAMRGGEEEEEKKKEEEGRRKQTMLSPELFGADDGGLNGDGRNREQIMSQKVPSPPPPPPCRSPRRSLSSQSILPTSTVTPTTSRPPRSRLLADVIAGLKKHQEMIVLGDTPVSSPVTVASRSTVALKPQTAIVSIAKKKKETTVYESFPQTDVSMAARVQEEEDSFLQSLRFNETRGDKSTPLPPTEETMDSFVRSLRMVGRARRTQEEEEEERGAGNILAALSPVWRKEPEEKEEGVSPGRRKEGAEEAMNTAFKTPTVRGGRGRGRGARGGGGGGVFGSHVKVLKWGNVTPRPAFEAMDDAALKSQLAHYGLRPMGRKRAIATLAEIYEQTHPVLDAAGAAASTSTTSASTTTAVGGASSSRSCSTTAASGASTSSSAASVAAVRGGGGEDVSPTARKRPADDEVVMEQEEKDADDRPLNGGVDSSFDDNEADSGEQTGEAEESISKAATKGADAQLVLFLDWLRAPPQKALYDHCLALKSISLEELEVKLKRADSALCGISKKALMRVLDRLHIT